MNAPSTSGRGENKVTFGARIFFQVTEHSLHPVLHLYSTVGLLSAARVLSVEKPYKNSFKKIVKTRHVGPESLFTNSDAEVGARPGAAHRRGWERWECSFRPA